MKLTRLRIWILVLYGIPMSLFTVASVAWAYQHEWAWMGIFAALAIMELSSGIMKWSEKNELDTQA
jgi:hypothetical protein